MAEFTTSTGRSVLEGSEDAFREVMLRNMDLVFHTALRGVNGDRMLAEDATQLVFLSLARKWKSLSHSKRISAWLYKAAYLTAGRLARDEKRRRRREARVAEIEHMEIDSRNAESPNPPGQEARVNGQLTRLLAKLPETDRTALIMRFYDERSFLEIGADLGLSEDAAQKRVSRALLKLRRKLQRSGPTTTAALASVLKGASPTPAPQQLASTVMSRVTSLTCGGTIAGSLVAFVTIMKTKIVITTLLSLAALAVIAHFRYNVRPRSKPEPQILLAHDQKARPSLLGEGTVPNRTEPSIDRSEEELNHFRALVRYVLDQKTKRYMEMLTQFQAAAKEAQEIANTLGDTTEDPKKIRAAVEGAKQKSRGFARKAKALEHDMNLFRVRWERFLMCFKSGKESFPVRELFVQSLANEVLPEINSQTVREKSGTQETVAFIQRHLRRGETEQGHALAEPLLESTPEDPSGYAFLVRLHGLLGNTDQARRLLNEGIGKFESDPILNRILAHAYLASGRYREASEAYKFANANKMPGTHGMEAEITLCLLCLKNPTFAAMMDRDVSKVSPRDLLTMKLQLAIEGGNAAEIEMWKETVRIHDSGDSFPQQEPPDQKADGDIRGTALLFPK